MLMGSNMSFDDIDLDRVVVDPDYRRQVIEFLNGSVGQARPDGSVEPDLVIAKTVNDTTV